MSLTTTLPSTAPPLGKQGPVARVLVCDDSVVARNALSNLLASDPDVEVVARAHNGEAALGALRRHQIDVVLLDIEMPVMDGLAALPLMLAQNPGLRVIVASTLTRRGAETALQALRLGAADYLHKPCVADLAGDGFRRELLAKVSGQSRLRRSGLPLGFTVAAPPRDAAVALRPAGKRPAIVAIGSSTGGPQALLALGHSLAAAPPQVPMLIPQHMPPVFTPILADHLARQCGLPCSEVRDRDPLLPGRIYLAPGDHHVIVEADGTGLLARLSDAPPENSCRPSVDVMLRSLAQVLDGRVLVVMLTGMGHDGLDGTGAVVNAGGTALAQDEATRVVWGMPGPIARAGLCHRVLPLPQVASAIVELSGTRR